jgi:hypothetical protein
MPTLKRSHDRKVTNMATPNGKRSAIANTFGLPSGKQYSCPYATSICERICYAGKLEKMYPSVREVLLHNWNALKDASRIDMAVMLDTMVNAFKYECEEKQVEKLFRIHWDGDFFSDDYIQAWYLVITQHPDVHFWVYTRNPDAAEALRDIPNLSLYFSADAENKKLAPTGVKVAYLADTFADAKQVMLDMTGKPGASCPEQLKRIPLISEKGGACAVCRLCVDGKSDIRFSISKR